MATHCTIDNNNKKSNNKILLFIHTDGLVIVQCHKVTSTPNCLCNKTFHEPYSSKDWNSTVHQLLRVRKTSQYPDTSNAWYRKIFWENCM